MLNSKKILVSLVLVMIMAISLGNVASLATTPIVANVSSSGDVSNETGTTITISNNTTSNNTVANNTTNNTTNVVNNVTNSSSYNTTSKSSLPYAGTNSNLIFIVIALVVSAIYAYKKVSNYNV